MGPLPLGALSNKIHDAKKSFVLICSLTQGGGSQNGLTQNSWFNSYHGLLSPLTPMTNTNTRSLNHLMNILPTFDLNMHLYML